MTSINNLPISISLNFDSLNEAYGFPNNYNDPSFFEGFNRLAEIAARYNAPLSIYVVGRDLENPNHASMVREWSQQGHEIGNHSWSHHFNLPALRNNKTYEEISKAHDLISEVTGKEPKGFISPTWSTSQNMLSILHSKGYEYDTSAFNSPLLYPMVLKIALNHIPDWQKTFGILRRRDWLNFLRFSHKPYFVNCFGQVTEQEKNNLIVMPLPQKNLFSPTIWHTVGYIFGWKYLYKSLERLLDTCPHFYYLIHPADFLSNNDQDKRFKNHLIRMEFSLKEKLEVLEEAFIIMKASGREFSTLLELSRKQRK